MNWQEILTVYLTLFAIIDIVGNLPLIIDLRQRWGSLPVTRTALYSGTFMILFWLSGEGLLHLVGVDIFSFAVAGAIVIFVISLEMILGIRIFREEAGSATSQERALVPLTFPLLVGPGTLTTILSLKAQFDNLTILIGIVANMVTIWLVLRLLPLLDRYLTPGIIAVMRRLFGVLLLAIAIRIFTSNLIYLIRSFQTP